MRRLNLFVLSVLLGAMALLGGGMYVVHDFQMRRNASALLDRARRAEAAGDLEKAEHSLGQYLNLRREDGSAWEWYARVVDQRDAERRRLERVFLVHEEALRYNPGDGKLERRCADLALELGRFKDAHRHFTGLRETSQPTGAGLAELEDLLGQCESGMTRHEQAEQLFLQAIEHDPRRVACYDRLARLRRAELRRTEAAERTIREMIAKNPDAGRAYIFRWRYAQEYAPPADAKDIQKALELGPDDLEVLLTAAVASEQKPDLASARLYWEKGQKLDPKSVAFALGLARLEVREDHLDRAEAVLRQAFEAKPSLELAFELAYNLILQDKVDGKDQADGYITKLRNAGLGNTYVAYLEVSVLFQRKQWREAIPGIERARIALRSDRRLTAQLNLMLAECYGRVGMDEQRMDALRQVADGDRGPEFARIEFAQALARSGKLDQAIGILLPMAERKPELRLDLVRLLIQRASRQPRDQRQWQEAEAHLREAQRALPQALESLTLLRADLLAAQDRLEDARSLVSAARAKDPRNLRYRLALARLAQGQSNGPMALQILGEAEKDLGPSTEIQLARLDYWGRAGGEKATAAVAKLAETRLMIPDPDRPTFLDRLAAVESRLGEPALAREHRRELARLQPESVQVLMGLFDLAMQAGDDTDAQDLVARIRKIEGERGTLWRFGQASYLLEQARRGGTKDLDIPRGLAEEVATGRPDWWGNSVLLAEIAELEGKTDEAIKQYFRAIELGNTQPALARRLVGLLNQNSQFDQIDRVVKILSDRGVAAADLTISTALNAIRQKDYDRGIAMARRVFSESSTHFFDHLFLGQFYMAAHRPLDAGKELRRAVELGPAVPITWVTYVQYLVLEKQADQARAAIDAARKALPADRANLALAQCYALVGDTEQAEAMIQPALQSPACDLATIRVATDIYINQGRFDKVEPILEKLRSPAMKATPEVLAWANRTRSLARLSTGRMAEMDQALALVEQNLKNYPSSLEDQRLKAILLAVRTSRRGDAIKLLEPLDQSNQLGINEQFILARTYLAERLVDKYRRQMLKILGAGVKNPRHLVHFIDFLINHKELDPADHWLSELKQVAPQSLGLLEREARLLDLRGRRPELMDLLQARGRQAPEEIGVVAGLLERFGFAGEAESAYKAFIVRKPDEPERVLTLASFLARQDRTKEAVAILDEASRTCRPEAVAGASLMLFVAPSADEDVKRRVEAWIVEALRKSPSAAAALRPKLATIYSKQGRYDEAETLFRQILISEPDNVETLNNLAWVLAVREPGVPREALELVDRAIEKAGHLSTLVDTRAVALIRVGEADRAAQELRDAKRADPENVSLALHLAWAYQAAGKPDEAQKAFRLAEELGLKPESRAPLERDFIDRLRRQLNTTQRSLSNRS
ncbi:MAG: tetratricopeptide repeat protein [Isosphaeraceae bacterium]